MESGPFDRSYIPDSINREHASNRETRKQDVQSTRMRGKTCTLTHRNTTTLYKGCKSDSFHFVLPFLSLHSPLSGLLSSLTLFVLPP